MQSQRTIVFTNLELIQKVIQQMTDDILTSAHLNPGDSVSVNIPPQECAWIVEQAIVTKMKSNSIIVFSQQESYASVPFLFEVRPVVVQLHYPRIFKDEISKSNLVEREVIAHLSCQIENRRTGEIVYSASLSRNSRDTITVDDVNLAEQGCVKVTHAELPADENILDKIVEPFVIIGATAVAIYLLFHIRS